MTAVVSDQNRMAEVAKRMRKLYPFVREYNKLFADLVKLGYKVDEGKKLKIWKEV